MCCFTKAHANMNRLGNQQASVSLKKEGLTIHVLRQLTLHCFVALFALFNPLDGLAAEKPNIVVILTDDQAPTAVGSLAAVELARGGAVGARLRLRGLRTGDIDDPLRLRLSPAVRESLCLRSS